MSGQQTSQQARLFRIADRLREYSSELEDFASDMEEGSKCNAMFAASYSIDEAIHILEELAKGADQ